MNRLALCLSAALLVIVPFTAHANKALADKSGCLGCHAIATKLVGPAYKDVAAKYADQADATDMLAKSIRAGGAGKWGEMPFCASSLASVPPPAPEPMMTTTESSL